MYILKCGTLHIHNTALHNIIKIKLLCINMGSVEIYFSARNWLCIRYVVAFVLRQKCKTVITSPADRTVIAIKDRPSKTAAEKEEIVESLREKCQQLSRLVNCHSDGPVQIHDVSSVAKIPLGSS